MTISGEHDSGTRPMPCAIGPRADAPPITSALATRMLPLVSRIAADVRVAWESWRTAVAQYDAVMAAVDADVRSPLARRAQEDVQARAAEVESLRNELLPLGATCPSPRTGRVEWATVIDGVDACLVWHPGDERVTRWMPDPAAPHELFPVPDEDDPSRS